MSAPVTAEELAALLRDADRLTPELQHPFRAMSWRLARDLAAARYDLDTERKASAMLADRNLDLGRELEALRAAVRAHRLAHLNESSESGACVDMWMLALKT